MCFNKILCLNGVYQFAPRPSFHYQPRYADPGRRSFPQRNRNGENALPNRNGNEKNQLKPRDNAKLKDAKETEQNETEGCRQPPYGPRTVS